MNLVVLSRQCGASRAPLRRCASASYAAATGSTDDEELSADMARLMETFKRADSNGDGVLQREELRTLLETVGDGEKAVTGWVTDADLDNIIRQYDANRDGVISFKEYQVLAKDQVFLTRALAEYRAAFNAIDTGRSGTISPTELHRLFVRLDSPLQQYERIVKLMEKYDLDGNGQIDFGEWLRLCRYENALPLSDILAYAGLSGDPPAGTAAAEPAVTARPGQVTTFFSKRDLEAIMAAYPDKLVVVQASLTWCRPCKKIQPAYEKLAAAYTAAVFLKFFGNSNEGTKTLFKDKLKVQVTPAFLCFRGGSLVASWTGANAAKFEANLRAALAGAEMPAEALYPAEAVAAA